MDGRDGFDTWNTQPLLDPACPKHLPLGLITSDEVLKAVHGIANADVITRLFIPLGLVVVVSDVELARRVLAWLPNCWVICTWACTSWVTLSLSKSFFCPDSASPVRAPWLPAMPLMAAVVVLLALLPMLPMPALAPLVPTVTPTLWALY